MAPKTPGHRPFTRAQQRQNQRFLGALRRTGNVRLACRELGVHRACYTKRRGKCAAFAASWDATLAAAHAAFEQAGGERLPEGKGTGTRTCPHSGNRPRSALRTKGGEPMVVSVAGRLQRRLAPPGRMTGAAQRLVLATVEETNNLRIATAAAGFASSSFIARMRLRPELAGRLAIARRIGADRAMWQIMNPPGRDSDRDFRILPMPPLTVEQALLQLGFHRPDGRFQQSLWRRRAPPKPLAHYRPRILAKLAAFRRARWHEETGSWRFPEESEDPTE
jgi:hypothetical protein